MDLVPYCCMYSIVSAKSSLGRIESTATLIKLNDESLRIWLLGKRSIGCSFVA